MPACVRKCETTTQTSHSWNEESKWRLTPKVNSVNRTHPAAQTPATGSDNYKVNKELQRSNPHCLEQTGVRMFEGPNSRLVSMPKRTTEATYSSMIATTFPTHCSHTVFSPWNILSIYYSFSQYNVKKKQKKKTKKNKAKKTCCGWAAWKHGVS